MSVRFWLIPLTYVALVGGAASIVIFMGMFMYAADAASKGHPVNDKSLYVAAALLYCACVSYSFLYNWRKTGSATLSISLTVLQSISACAVIALFNLWLGGRSTQKYKDEHGID